MTPYRKGWLFIAWILLVLVSFPFWFTFLMDNFGETGGTIGQVFLLSHGLAMLFVFRCPSCGRSVFMRNFVFWAPWPVDQCTKCGRDLTVS